MRPDPRPNPTRRGLRGCGIAALVVFAAMALGGGYLYKLWQALPEGWQRVEAIRQQTTPRQRRKLAADVEKRVLSGLSLRPLDSAGAGAGATQTVTISPVELNAWLEYRLPMWAANQGVPIPDRVRGIRYWAEDGRPVLAARVALDGAARVLSVTLRLDLAADGTARLTIGGVRGGRLSMPRDRLVGRVIDELRRRDADSADAMARLLSGEPFHPVIAIDGERQARLVAFSVDAEGITMRFRSEPRGAHGAERSADAIESPS